MSSSLPVHPSLEWLRKTAKQKLRALRVERPDVRLADAQLAVAREYGFPSWRQLKAHVEVVAGGTAAGAAAAGITDETTRAFLQMVGAGRLDDVRAALAASPALVNAAGPHPFWGGTPQPLHVAVETTRRDMIDLLLASGADVNGLNEQYDHWSPLMLAINRDLPDVRNELLRRGARIGLAEALLLENDRRVEELLKSGLPEYAPNRGSFLSFARTRVAIDALLSAGASTEMKDRWGTTPMEALSRLGPRGRQLVQHLALRGIAAQAADYARLGDRDTLERLAAADPNVTRSDEVMMAAVDFKHHGLVRWLLELGAHVNARSSAESTHTALHSAAWNGDLEMVKLLVTAGADVRARDSQYDGTPAGWAATAIEVENNHACEAVVAYLRAFEEGHGTP